MYKAENDVSNENNYASMSLKSSSKRGKPRTIVIEDDSELNEISMTGNFGPTLSSKSSPPKALYAISRQRNHVNRMVEEAKNIASNITKLKDSVPSPRANQPYYSSPITHYKEKYNQQQPPIPSPSYPQQTIISPPDGRDNTQSIQLLQDHIKDIHLTYKIEITRHKEEIKQLKQNLENRNNGKQSKIDLANEKFQQEQHIAQLRNQWIAAEEIARNDFRNKLMNEYRDKEILLQDRMDRHLTLLKTQFEQTALEQSKIDLKTSEIKQNNAVRNVLQNERYKIRKYFRNLMNELTEELKDLWIVNKKQQASLQVLNEWKIDMLKKLKVFAKTFDQLRNDIGILKRRHPQNLQLLEKKYSVELNDLSNDLQNKIEEYSSVKKEKDHEYFLKKRFERRLREAKFHENASSIEKPMVGRKSPLSPTAFGCD